MNTKLIILLLMISCPALGQMNTIDNIENTKSTKTKINNNFYTLQMEKLDITTASNTYVTKSSATSEVCYLDGNRVLEGFTALGTGNVQIKVKTLTGTTGRMNDGTGIAHGLTGEKIIGFTAKIHQLTNHGVAPGYEYSAGYNYECYHNDTNFVIQLSSTNSTSIQEKPFTIVVLYIE